MLYYLPGFTFILTWQKQHISRCELLSKVMRRLKPSCPELHPGATSVMPASAMVTLQAPVTDSSLDQSDDAMEDAKKLVGSDFVRGRCIYDRRTSYPSSCNWHPTGRHVWWVLSYFCNYMYFIPHLFEQQICQTWNAASFVSVTC